MMDNMGWRSMAFLLAFSLYNIAFTTAKSCPPIDKWVYHGKLIQPQNASTGDVAKIHCDKPYVVSNGKATNTTTVKCQSDGTWNRVVPNCRPPTTTNPQYYFEPQKNYSMTGTVWKEIFVPSSLASAACSVHCWRDIRCLHYNLIFKNNSDSVICQMLDIPFGIVVPNSTTTFYGFIDANVCSVFQATQMALPVKSYWNFENATEHLAYNGSSATLECRDGLLPSKEHIRSYDDPPKIMCSKGFWTEGYNITEKCVVPVCLKSETSRFNLPLNSVWNYSNATTEVAQNGSIATLECTSGFILVNDSSSMTEVSPSILCAKGVWTGVYLSSEKCVHACSVLEATQMALPEKSYWNFENATEHLAYNGSSATFECRDGLLPSKEHIRSYDDPPKILCSKGFWTGGDNITEKCVVPVCLTTETTLFNPPLNFVWNYSNATLEVAQNGSIATLECASGFILVNDSSMTEVYPPPLLCAKGVWTGVHLASEICVSACARFDLEKIVKVENSSLKYSNATVKHAHNGSTATLECASGLNLVKGNSISLVSPPQLSCLSGLWKGNKNVKERCVGERTIGLAHCWKTRARCGGTRPDTVSSQVQKIEKSGRVRQLLRRCVRLSNRRTKPCLSFVHGGVLHWSCSEHVNFSSELSLLAYSNHFITIKCTRDDYTSYINKAKCNQLCPTVSICDYANLSSENKCENLANNHRPASSLCEYTIDLDAVTGQIYSTNNPNKYFNFEECIWHIVTTPGYRLMLVFKDFQLESCCDHVDISDSSTGSPSRYGSYFGTKMPNITITKFNDLIVAFTTDYSNVYHGFLANYNTVCGGELQAEPENNTGYIYSHVLYSHSNYDKNILCNWTIYAKEGERVQLQFTHFDLQQHSSCSYDFIEVYDGNHEDTSLGRYCGNTIPREFNSTGTNLTLVFKTDDNFEHEGFLAEYFSYT